MIETDYLVIGAGAAGLAFTDTILSESDFKVTLVDREDRVGGHWVHAYPFVQLHQPSRHYGVASRVLETEVCDDEGLANRATRAELLDYYQNLMDEVFLPSGRVQYLPNSEVRDDDTVVSLKSGDAQEVVVRRRVVEAGDLGGAVPSTHIPAFDVAPDVNFVPVNALADLSAPPARFVILGSGKTAIDACLWLLSSGTEPDAISWVMPRDSWFLDRRQAQPDASFFELKVRRARDENRALMEATSIDDLYDRLESTGNLLRLDPDVRPTAFKCATVTDHELAELRRIKDVVRKGHVHAVADDRIVLTAGEIPLGEDTLVVDCTASGIPNAPNPPIFRPGRIVPNGIRTCQPTFCAALLAHLDLTIEDDGQKNELCQIIPMPRDAIDWLRMGLINRQNQYAWLQNPELRGWLKSCRLDMLTNAEQPDEPGADVLEMQAELKQTMIPSTMRMHQLLKMAEME